KRILARSKRLPVDLLSQDVLHAVEPRPLPAEELGGSDGAAGEGVAAEGAVGQLDLLALAHEEHVVLADNAAGPHGVEADVAGLARRDALPAVGRHVGQRAVERGYDGVREAEGRA